MQNLIPIGPEGATINQTVMNRPADQQLSNRSENLDQNELMRRLSVWRQIDAQRGLKPEEMQAFTDLNDEMRRRQQSDAGSSARSIMDIFNNNGGGGGSGVGAPGSVGGGGANVPSGNDLVSGLEEAISRQRSNLSNLYNSQVQGSTDKYNAALAPLRRKMIQEQASLGRLNSPVSNINMGEFDQSRDQGLADIVRGLSEQNFQSQAGLEENALNRLQDARQNSAEMGLRSRMGQSDLDLRRASTLAGMIQQGNQFGQTFGLDQSKFIEDSRKNSLSDLRQQQAMDLAQEEGRRRADNENDTFGNIASIVGGLGGLGTGIGGLAGGIAAYKGLKGLSAGSTGGSSATRKPMFSDTFTPSPKQPSLRAKTGYSIY